MENLRPGEYEVYLEKLNNICVEATSVFIRTGITHMLRSGDSIVGIYTVEGDLVTALSKSCSIGWVSQMSRNQQAGLR